MTGHETQFVRQACVYFRNKTTIWFAIYIKYCTWLPATKYCYFHSKCVPKIHRQQYQTHKEFSDRPISIKEITLLRLRVNYININSSYDQLLLVTVRPIRSINILSLVQFQIRIFPNIEPRYFIVFNRWNSVNSSFYIQLTQNDGISSMHLTGRTGPINRLFLRTHINNEKILCHICQ